MPVVEVPGMGDVEFPDDMTDEQIAAAIEANMSPPEPAQPASVPGIGGMGNFNPFASRVQADASRGMSELGMTPENVANPLTNALGPLETVGQAGSGLLGMVAGGWAGIGQGLKNTFAPQPDAMTAGDRVNQVAGGITYQPRTGLGQGMSRIVGLPGEAWSAGTTKAGEFGTDVTGSPFVGATIKTLGDLAPAAATAGESAAFTRGITRGSPNGSYTPKIEPLRTTDELKAASNATYKAADEQGVVIRPESTQKAIDIFRRVAEEENLGKLPPKLNEAVTILQDRLAAKKPLSLKDADKVRQLINDAFKSQDAGDQRLAAIVKDQYDGYLETLSPTDTLAGNSAHGVALLGEARDLWGRAKKSEMLDSMENKAGLTGESKYTQAGLEHALRQEFLRLAKNDREMKKLSPEEQAAIRKVAAPGAKANLVRNVGKMDPTRGGMAANINTVVGGGLGAAMGGLLGGIPGAAGGAVVGPALIGGAANLANRSALKTTQRNVANARETLVGRGQQQGGLLTSGNKPLTQPRGLLGTNARPLTEIRNDLQVLDAEVKRLAEMGPVADTVRKSVEAELALLRRELATAESQGASP
jgi:hypothetical protein